MLGRSHPRRAPPGRPAAIADGFRYLKGKPVLQGTYIIDFIAMVFGMPRALFPFFADMFGGDQYLGLLCAAPAFGAWWPASCRAGPATSVATASASSARPSRGVSPSSAFGISPGIWWAVLFLALAGAADLFSVIFRRTIWATLISDEYRGRLGDIAWANVRTGPVLGDVEAGVMARLTSVRLGGSGGLACVAGAVSLRCCCRVHPLPLGARASRGGTGAPAPV